MQHEDNHTTSITHLKHYFSLTIVQQLVDQHAAGGAHPDEQHDVRVVQPPQDLGLLKKLLFALEGVCVSRVQV